MDSITTLPPALSILEILIQCPAAVDTTKVSRGEIIRRVPIKQGIYIGGALQYNYNKKIERL